MVAASGVELETTSFDLGAGRYAATGAVLPDETLEELRGFDAILLGAVGPPVGGRVGAVPGGARPRSPAPPSVLELDLYVNLRPFVGVPGSIGEGSDFAVVRENAGRDLCG